MKRLMVVTTGLLFLMGTGLALAEGAVSASAQSTPVKHKVIKAGQRISDDQDASAQAAREALAILNGKKSVDKSGKKEAGKAKRTHKRIRHVQPAGNVAAPTSNNNTATGSSK